MSPLDGTDGVCFQSGLCSSSELETSRGSIRIQHLTGSSHAAEQGAATRFPRLEECAHFHYEFAEIGPLQVGIVIYRFIVLIKPYLMIRLSCARARMAGSRRVTRRATATSWWPSPRRRPTTAPGTSTSVRCKYF